MRGVMGTTAAWVRSYTAFFLVLLLVGADAFLLLERGLWRAMQAEALIGDVSIFREAAGGTTVTTSVAPVTWDTVVTQNANIPLNTTNESDITLSEGGKYLVLYNTWTEKGALSGSNPRTIDSFLRLNSTDLAYGRASGHLSDLNDSVTAHTAGATIVSAAPNDVLQVRVQRADANTAGQSAIRANSNAVQVLKLNDDLDYLRLRRTSNTANIGATTAFTNIEWQAADEVDTGSFTFTPTSGNITLRGPVGQRFLVTANVRVEQTASSNRFLNFEMRGVLDGNEVAGSRVNTFIEGNLNSSQAYFGTMTYTGIVTKTAATDQTFNLQFRRESTRSINAVIVGTETAMTMVALPAAAETISLSHNTTQALTAAQSPFLFNTQLSTPASTFTHSTTVNNSRVQVNTTGDYLFLSTAYNTRTTGTTRWVPRLEWRRDGTSVFQYGGHGSMNRGRAQGDDAYSSGSSGGIIIPNLSSGSYIELLHSNETTGTPNNSFTANGVSLHGISLASLIPPFDIEVEATGAVTSTVAPGATQVHLGPTFVVRANGVSRTLQGVTFSALGTLNANADTSQVRLRYAFDTTAPFDCVGVSHNTSLPTFGSVTSFSVGGQITFSGSETIPADQAICLFPELTINSTAFGGETFGVQITNPQTQVTFSTAPTISPDTPVAGATLTTVHNAELTQAGYHWRNDDGSETDATSAVSGQANTPGLTFDRTEAYRLRIGVAALGFGSSTAQYRLEVTEKVTTCAAATGWVTVGSTGAPWQMFDSDFVAEGQNTTNIPIGDGGVPDGGDIFVSPNGGIRDVTAQTGTITLEATTSKQFVELEYAITATGDAVDGVAYCFRVTDAGTPLRNYAQYPEVTFSADVTVSALGSQIATVARGLENVYFGGTFVFRATESTQTLTEVTLTETGTINATKLSNPRLAYRFDTTAPYDCSSVSFDGTEPIVSGTAFSGANGTSTFSGSIVVSPTSTVCAYFIASVAADSNNGDTIDIAITNPNQDVVATGATVGPGSVISITGSTTVLAPEFSQTGYHWRNEDGSETDATSATGGAENTPIEAVQLNSVTRVRLAVRNVGSLTATSTVFTLQYGTRVTTCANVGTWQTVGEGPAFTMAGTSGLVHGNNTTNITPSSGGVSDPGGSFVGTNGGQRVTTATSAAVTIPVGDFTELEFAVRTAETAAFATTYCFRLVADNAQFASYIQYPELTVQDRQDFSIQQGVTNMVGINTLTLTAGVDYVAPASSSRAFVRITNTSMTGAGSNVTGATQNSNNIFAYIVVPTDLTTSFQIVRPGTATGNTRVAWELVEYIGVAGGDNEFIVRSVGTATYGGSSLTVNGGTVSGVQNDADVAVFITGQLNPDAGNNNYNTALSISSWNGASNVPVFERGDADGVAAGVSYAVVEFTGINWRVQRVTHTYATNNTVETATITPVNNLSRAFLHVQQLTGDEQDNLDQVGQEVWLSSIGQISLRLQDGAATPASIRAAVWVIENTQITAGAMNVVRYNGSLAAVGGGPTTNLVNFASPIVPGNSSIWAVSRSTRGNGANARAHPRALIGVRILSTTQFELWQSDSGQSQIWRAEVVQWPVADTSLRQTHYRFYEDNGLLTPANPWPAETGVLGENTAMTDADFPLGLGQRVRIRTGLLVNNASLIAESLTFKLQYGLRVTTCAAIASWTDVGGIGSGAAWRGVANGPADGTTLNTLLLSVGTVAGTYERENPSVPNPFTAEIGDYIEHDWILEQNAANPSSSYCFRVVQGDGAELVGYDNYPIVRTSTYLPRITNWRWYTDIDTLTPTVPAAGEQVTPIDAGVGDTFTLRVAVTEVAGAPSDFVKFNVQYSEYPDFRDGGTILTATSSCTGGTIWCFADGAGNDNDILESVVLSGTDSCIAGVGPGCGTRNEGIDALSSFTQAAYTTSEHEFYLRHDGARVNTVYYFRLFEVGSNQVVAASSSFPSIATEGAILTFQVDGIAASTTIAGQVTAATTTATAVAFGLLPMDQSVAAAQRLTVFTNGTEGYQVFMDFDSPLLDGYGNEIASVVGTNAVPTTWASGCNAAATGCFGYTTTDSILSGNSTRFALSDTYAGIEPGPVEVMASGVPVTFDVADILFRTQVGYLQPAGEYQTTVRYIIVPRF